MLTRLLVFSIPSFLQPRHIHEPIRSGKPAPTAYLNGLRGLAALFVYIFHYSYQAYNVNEGWGCDETNYHFLKLPFIRILYGGPAAVSIFFVLSGYTLSYKTSQLIQSHSYAEFVNTISSLAFRRGIRLFLPPAASTTIIICLIRLGVYEHNEEFAHNKTYMRYYDEEHPHRMDTASEQWSTLWWLALHVFDWDRTPPPTNFDGHLWTIPVEFRCSLYLFITVIGTARLQTKWRFLAVTGLIWIIYRNCNWPLMLFLCGMLIAELDHIRGAHVPPTSSLDQRPNPLSPSIWGRMMTWLWSLVSILGFYLICQPQARAEITPGWIYLSSLIPEWWQDAPFRYWQSMGAVIFVLAIGYSPAWQQFFNNAFIQYLGKISYALYLIHGPTIHSLGFMFERWAFSLTGIEDDWSFNTAFILGAVLSTSMVIWCADVFWRAVDIPAIQFAKWVEGRLIVKS
ncbi:acyltransferase 3 [Stachybotrys elegans]|uniref:Acyltransferase 3 n=1 Tax=Stachybotrys elegans TaxID=80388 RepID=A0A8K0SFD3_9HYPO|nr:acyltransferase 3 [Stachybotrys elegans]